MSAYICFPRVVPGSITQLNVKGGPRSYSNIPQYLQTPINFYKLIIINFNLCAGKCRMLCVIFEEEIYSLAY